MARRKGVLLGVTVGVALLGASVAYGWYFHDRALPGTSVAGRSVTGLTREQVAGSVQARSADVRLTLTAGAAVRSGHLAELGCTVDVAGTVARTFEANRSWTAYLTTPFSGRRITPVVDVDQTRSDATISALVASSGKAGSDATVVRSADGSSFVATAPVPGRTVAPGEYRTAVEGAAQALTSRDVTLPMVEAPPRVTLAQAQKVADAADALIAHAVVLTDGQSTYSPSPAQKADWVSIPMVGGSPGAPAVDAAKVKAWLDQTAQSTNVDVTEGVRVVDAEGRVLSVVQRAKDGRTVTNVDAILAELSAALGAGADYSGAFAYETVAATWTQQPVAVGALVYSPAPGEKWIDVNLANHTMTAYEGTTVVRGPIAMVNGAKLTPTVVGTFHIYSKVRTQTMRGANADGTRYETPDVPWIAYFYSGYALHGAPWRSTFGYTGSHGCINLPVPVAKWVYTWAPVGTTVITHR